jgi:hypothetical protein
LRRRLQAGLAGPPAPENTGAPAVANGVVYVSAGNSARNVCIYAFSVHCATGGGACTPLWRGNGGSYYMPSDPAVAGGELWTTGGPVNGPANLYAFGCPSRARPAPLPRHGEGAGPPRPRRWGRPAAGPGNRRRREARGA